MSWLTTIRDTLLGSAPMDLTHSRPQAFGEGMAFGSLDDPALSSFFRVGRETSTGVVVNERIALRNSAMYRASSLISGATAMLGVNLYRKTTVTRTVPGNPEADPPVPARQMTSASAEKLDDHPMQRVIRNRPNSFQTPFEFWSYMVQRALFDGVAYAVISKKVSAITRGGWRVELIPLRPTLVEPRMSRDWQLSFRYHDPNGPPMDIPSSQMFWFRSPVSSDGVTGAALLDVAAEAIGLAHTSEKASGRVLRNGAIVGGVLQHPKALSEPAIERLRNQFEERQSTPENAGKWIVAEDGMTAHPFGTTLKDAQTSEMRSFQIEELSRFTGVPRPLMMMDETSWGSGIEQLGLFLITYCLMPWFVSIEQAIWRSLLTEAEQADHYAKFNDGALLRGSLKDQAEFFAKALGSGGGRGWMTQNEVRDKFEMNPMDGGDELPEPITKPAPNEGGDKDDPEDKPTKPKPKGGSDE